MAKGIPVLKDAPYNVLTVPNYVRSLVVTTKPAQVIAAYTAPPGVEAWRPVSCGVRFVSLISLFAVLPFVRQAPLSGLPC